MSIMDFFITRTAWCPKCQKYRAFNVITILDQFLHEGEIYTAAQKKAYCDICGSPVYVSTLNQENINRRQDAVQRGHKLYEY